MLTERITPLSQDRMHEVCQALRYATCCGRSRVAGTARPWPVAGGWGHARRRGRPPRGPHRRLTGPTVGAAGPSRRLAPVALHDAETDELVTRLRAQPDVVVAYLFGSTARGTAGPTSDVDVAVLLAPEPPPLRRLELLAEVAAVVGSERADLVVLNDAPPAVGYRVVAEGTPLLVRDEAARVRYTARIVDRYLDLAPVRRELASAQRHRLEEGRFGRR